MHRLMTILPAMAICLASTAGAQTATPQSRDPRDMPPGYQPGPVATYGQPQIPAKTPPPANPPTQTQPPPAQGQWVWQPAAPQQPVAQPPPQLVYQPIQYVQPPQQAVYAVPQPVQAQYQTVTALPPTTIQLGGGLVSAGLTRAGQCLVSLGGTRTTLTLQRTRTTVGMPAPMTTYATSYTIQQPVQTQYYPVGVPYQPPVGSPPPAQQPPPPCPNPGAHEAAPPPPAVPRPSGQSQSGQGQRRIGLLEGIFGAH